MKYPPFELERFFARWEFTARYNLAASDVEPLAVSELMDFADANSRSMWDCLTLGYTETQGHPMLREEICSLYETVSPADVLVFSGAEEAIFVWCHASIRPGDHVLVVTPAYQSLVDVPRALGADVELIPLTRPGWTFDLEALTSRLRRDTRAVIVNFPHSPTGSLPSAATWESLLRLSEERGFLVLSDEVYRFLEHDASDRLRAAVDGTARATSVGVLSKAFGLAGLRIGWIASRDRQLLAAAARVKDYTTICNSAPSEILAIAALRAREQLLDRARRIVQLNLPILSTFFEERSSLFEYSPPRAGTTAFPALCADIQIDDFVDQTVRQSGVLLLPGTIFGDSGNHFRVGFGRVNMPDVLDQFSAYLVGDGSRLLQRTR